MLKDVVERVPVADFLALRFLVAAAAVTLLAPRALARLTPRASAGTPCCSGWSTASRRCCRPTGLQTTSASVSGFLTGMYVVFTPVLGALLLRHRTSRR